MSQLTKEDAHNALTFLNRVDLKGSEAEPMAMLKMKLRAIANPEQVKPPPAPGRDSEGLDNVTELAGHKGEGAA